MIPSVGYQKLTSPDITQSCSAWMFEKCRRFSKATSQIATLALDILFFWGKKNADIPNWVTKGALTGLSSVGLIALPYNLDLIKKTIQDALFALKAKSLALSSVAAIHSLELISNSGLIAAGFAASLEGDQGNTSLQTTLYHWMTPWGEVTLAVGLGMTLTYLLVTHSVLKQLKNEESFDAHADHIIAAFEGSGDEYTLAARVRFCMDKDTFMHFLDHLKEETDTDKKKEMIRIVLSNMDTQQKINLSGQLALTLTGYILMAIEKYYTPNSLVSASINLGVSSAYTFKTLLEIVREVYQRHRITEIAHSHI